MKLRRIKHMHNKALAYMSFSMAALFYTLTDFAQDGNAGAPVMAA